MASITSAASGNWNAGGTWVGGAIPVSGDTVIIANGHTVTIPSGYTAVVGSSPANDTGTPAIQTASATGTGILVIAAGGNLTYKGPIRQGSANWTVGAGCILTHDSSGASVPASAHYTWQVGQTAFAPTKLTLTGAAGVRWQAKIAVGSGNSGGWQNGGNADCGQVIGTYGTVTDWGTSTLAACRSALVSSGGKQTFLNCDFDRCGAILSEDCRNGCDYRFTNSTTTNGIASDGVQWGCDFNFGGFRVDPTTGTREIRNAYVDGNVSIFASIAGGQTGLHVADVVITGTTALAPLSASAACGVAEWNNVLLYNRVAGGGQGSGSPSGTLTRSLLLAVSSINPHWIQNVKATMSWDGWVAECDGEADGTSGDLFQTATSATPFTLTVKHGLVIPTPAGVCPCAVVNHSDSAGAGPSITLEHCTWEGNDTGNGTGGAGGENNTGRAGLFASVRANNVWKAASGAGRVTKWHSLSTPVAGTYANADYNNRWNLTGIPYFRSDTDPAEYTVTPGAHDATADPQFTDASRKFLAWAQSVDPTVTSWADAMNRFSRMNDDSGSVAGFTVSACYDWIRAGWVPTNAALNTSYPGDTEQFLGFAPAVASGPTGPTATQKLFYRTMQYAASIGALLLSPALSFFGARHV